MAPMGCELVSKLTCIFFPLKECGPNNPRLKYYLAHAHQIIN